MMSQRVNRAWKHSDRSPTRSTAPPVRGSGEALRAGWNWGINDPKKRSSPDRGNA
jgi:hypothetical protein